MEQENYIDFKRERDLGDILSDTFSFIRYNYKPLFRAVVRIVGPILVVFLLVMAAYLYLMFGKGVGLFSILESNPKQLDAYFGNFFGYGVITVLTMIFLSALYYGLFYATINYCIQSYIDHRGKIMIDEVAARVRMRWGSFFGMALLGGLMISIGTLFCIIPGIYLYVPMSLVFAIMVFYNYGVGSSISYSFTLIKHNWWMSFFTLLIMGIIFYLASGIFQLPAAIYSWVKTFTSAKEITVDTLAQVSQNIDWIYILLSLIAYLARYLFYSLMIICATFIFFSLNEKKNQTGALEAIDRLGDRDNQDHADSTEI